MRECVMTCNKKVVEKYEDTFISGELFMADSEIILINYFLY